MSTHLESAQSQTETRPSKNASKSKTPMKWSWPILTRDEFSRSASTLPEKAANDSAAGRGWGVPRGWGRARSGYWRAGDWERAADQTESALTKPKKERERASQRINTQGLETRRALPAARRWRRPRARERSACPLVNLPPPDRPCSPTPGLEVPLMQNSCHLFSSGSPQMLPSELQRKHASVKKRKTPSSCLSSPLRHSRDVFFKIAGTFFNR